MIAGIIKSKSIVAFFIASFILSSVSFAQKKVMTSFIKKIPLGDEKRLDVRIEVGGGTILIEKGVSNTLFSADALYNAKKTKPRFAYDVSSGEGHLRFKMIDEKRCEDCDDYSDWGDWDYDKDIEYGTSSSKETRWDFRFTDEIPISFMIEAGAVKANLDFSGLKIEDIRIENGVSRMMVRFDEPNPIRMSTFEVDVGVAKFKGKKLLNANFDEMIVETGVGTTTLDLTGKLDHRAIVDISLSIGSTVIYIPRDIPVTLHADVSFLTALDTGELEQVKKGEYFNEGVGDSQGELIIYLRSSGIASVDIEYEGF